MRYTLLAIVLLAAFSALGCSTAPDSPEARALLVDDANRTLNTFKKLNPGAHKAYTESSVGVAVFPAVGKGGAGIGGAYGKGVVFDAGNLAGYCKIEELNIGFQLGGQEQSMIMFFGDDAALNRFKRGEVAGDASASAVAVNADASASADFKNGVATYTFDSAGAMYQATVGGKRFKFVPKDAYED